MLIWICNERMWYGVWCMYVCVCGGGGWTTNNEKLIFYSIRCVIKNTNIVLFSILSECFIQFAISSKFQIFDNI